MHPFLVIGSLSLPMYGLCALAGTVVALIVLYFLRKKSPLSADAVLDTLIWTIILGMLGAKLLYFITDPPSMPESWSQLWEMISTGLVFYGGLLGGLLGAAVACRKNKVNFVSLTDLLLPCFCFAHAGGRVGCLMAGCCFGIVHEGFLCFTLNGVSRLGTQIMEAMFLAVLGIFLTLLYNSRKLRRGTVSSLYMLLYAVWRFIIEFYRDDYRGNVGALSTSQFISLFIFAAGVALFIFSRRWPVEALPQKETAPADGEEKPADEEPSESMSQEDDAPASEGDAEVWNKEEDPQVEQQ